MKSSRSLTEYKFLGGSWFPIVMGGLMSASVILPYFIVLTRGTLSPFLPYVSQSSGSPPQSGVFNFFLVLSCLFAFIGLNLLHMAIRVQKKRLKDDWIRNLISILNNITLVPGHVGIFGIIVVGSYPIDFYRESEEWFKVTIVPHAFGAMTLFLGGLFYCIIITYILFLLNPGHKKILGIRIFLICLITMCSVVLGITVNEGFWEEDVKYLTRSCVVKPESIPYNLSYLIGSVSEWALVFFFILFFLTLKDEAKKINFTMTITVDEEAEAVEKETPKKDVNSNLNSSQNQEEEIED